MKRKAPEPTLESEEDFVESAMQRLDNAEAALARFEARHQQTLLEQAELFARVKEAEGELKSAILSRGLPLGKDGTPLVDSLDFKGGGYVATLQQGKREINVDAIARHQPQLLVQHPELFNMNAGAFDKAVKAQIIKPETVKIAVRRGDPSVTIRRSTKQ